MQNNIAGYSWPDLTGSSDCFPFISSLVYRGVLSFTLIKRSLVDYRATKVAGVRLSFSAGSFNLELALEHHISLAFPTLIGMFRFPNVESVNNELKELILAKEKSEPNVQHANVGGWHSRPDLLEWPGEAVKSLKGWMADATNKMIASTMEQMRSGGISRQFTGSLSIYGWANVSRQGNYHSLHNHPGSSWSGVYYVDAGGPTTTENPNAGVIDLLDPRPFTEMTYVPGDPYGQKYSIRPEPGLMLMFPGFLYHFVHPHFSQATRISIAFNVRAEKRRPA